MKYFKYLLFFLISLFSIHASAICYHPATYPGTAYKPFPSTVCYPEDSGSGYCQFKVINSGLDIEVPCTSNCGSAPAYSVSFQSVSSKVYQNSDCTNPPLQDGCVQLPNGSIECEEDDDDDNSVLQCSADSCLNPDNKRCPSGYTSGSFNGQKMCVKNSEEENCEGDDCDNDQRIVDAVNDANNSITNSINNLSNSFGDSLSTIRDLLADISDKIQNIGNSNGNNGNGNNGNGNGNSGEVDTSEFAADLPVVETDSQQLNQNIFSSSSQCPADNELHLNFLSSSLTYSFSYEYICDALHTLSYLVMIFAYLVAALIVIRA